MLKFLKSTGDFIGRHWKTAAALAIAATAFGGVLGGLIAFPAAITAISGFVAFGVAPFAILAGMSVVAAAATVAAVAAVSLLAGFAAFNLATYISNWLDEKILPNAPEVRVTATDAVETEVTEVKQKGSFARLIEKLPCCKKGNSKVEDEVIKEVDATIAADTDASAHYGSVLSKVAPQLNQRNEELEQCSPLVSSFGA